MGTNGLQSTIMSKCGSSREKFVAFLNRRCDGSSLQLDHIVSIFCWADKPRSGLDHAFVTVVVDLCEYASEPIQSTCIGVKLCRLGGVEVCQHGSVA